ncbi:MAG TPA: type II secretion system protein [Candidatus Paceibacterota bacterium]|nr:type II secretion system protein [Candidatus Paceibacterota bacterium]
MNKKSLQAGFTLVELLVSLALFTVIVVAAVGSLYTINQASQRVSAMRTVLDNLNFATESMSRTIRTGSTLVCGGVSNGTGKPNCPFGNSNGAAQEISLTSTLPGSLGGLDYRRVTIPGSTNGAHEIQKCVLNTDGSLNTNNCVAITSPQINVTQLYFYVDGVGVSGGQPSVTMIMQGVANAGGSNIAPFAVQSFISQRAAQ